MENFFFNILLFYLHYFSRSVGEENFGREIFEEYITNLQEKAKEKERKREEEKVWILFYYKLWLSLYFISYFLGKPAKTSCYMAF